MLPSCMCMTGTSQCSGPPSLCSGGSLVSCVTEACRRRPISPVTYTLDLRLACQKYAGATGTWKKTKHHEFDLRPESQMVASNHGHKIGASGNLEDSMHVLVGALMS